MFDCVLRSLCSALSPTTPSATIINVIVRMSGTAVGVFLAENLSSLTLSKVRDFERVPDSSCRVAISATPTDGSVALHLTF